MLANVLRTIDDRKDAAVVALTEFLRIPSVSTKPDHAPEMRRCATWLADQLKAGGLRAELRETGGGKGHPLVLAKNEHKPGRPTVVAAFQPEGRAHRQRDRQPHDRLAQQMPVHSPA